MQRLATALYNLEVPTIAAVNGPAIGAGLDLACMCDIRIASEKAKFAASFIKVGIIPGDGGAWLLPRVVGLSRAMEMSFTGDTIDAQAALACGLVSRVVPAAELMATVLAAAQQICEFSGPSVMMAKESVNRAYEGALAEGIVFERRLFHSLFATEDQKEGMDAFVAKRKPAFRQR